MEMGPEQAPHDSSFSRQHFEKLRQRIQSKYKTTCCKYLVKRKKIRVNTLKIDIRVHMLCTCIYKQEVWVMMYLDNYVYPFITCHNSTLIHHNNIVQVYCEQVPIGISLFFEIIWHDFDYVYMQVWKQWRCFSQIESTVCNYTFYTNYIH